MCIRDRVVLELRRSDYETYDYREFWQDNKRQYEDYSERTAIRKLFAGCLLYTSSGL